MSSRAQNNHLMSSDNKKRPLRDELREHYQEAKRRRNEEEAIRIAEEKKVLENASKVIDEFCLVLFPFIDEEAKLAAKEGLEKSWFKLQFNNSIKIWFSLCLNPHVFGIDEEKQRRICDAVKIHQSYLVDSIKKNYNEMYRKHKNFVYPGEVEFQLYWE